MCYTRYINSEHSKGSSSSRKRADCNRFGGPNAGARVSPRAVLVSRAAVREHDADAFVERGAAGARVRALVARVELREAARAGARAQPVRPAARARRAHARPAARARRSRPDRRTSIRLRSRSGLRALAFPRVGRLAQQRRHPHQSLRARHSLSFPHR